MPIQGQIRWQSYHFPSEGLQRASSDQFVPLLVRRRRTLRVLPVGARCPGRSDLMGCLRMTQGREYDWQVT